MILHIPDTLPLNCLDWTRFISLIGTANAELARYDATLQAIVNPQVLLSPLTTQEAVLSSKIEGTQTSLEEVLQYDASLEVAPERRNDMHEVLNYRRAMREAIEYMQMRPVCPDLVHSRSQTGRTTFTSANAIDSFNLPSSMRNLKSCTRSTTVMAKLAG